MTEADAVAGVDEVGRGALAGPVVAAACILLHPVTKQRMSPPRWKPRLVRNSCFLADSKLLSPDDRELSFQWLLQNSAFGIGFCSAEEINRIGILHATEAAMAQALLQLQLRLQPSIVLVDGRDRFLLPFPHRTIIRGDQSEPSIAAASIIAKVTRDRFLAASERNFPGFCFSRHKGYGTSEHLSELKTHGPTTFHRTLFIRKALGLLPVQEEIFSDAASGATRTKRLPR